MVVMEYFIDSYNFLCRLKFKRISRNVLICINLLLCVRRFVITTSPEGTGITHWKLKNGDVVPASEYSSSSMPSSLNTKTRGAFSPVVDPIFGILLRMDDKEKLFISEDKDRECYHVRTPCEGTLSSEHRESQLEMKVLEGRISSTCKKCSGERVVNGNSCGMKVSKPLICSDDTVKTPYDFLEGIAKRKYHRNYPEPEVAMIFRKSDSDDAIELVEVEHRLKTLLKEHPHSSSVFNQIGNYWRIQGNTFHAIECFRKALALKPENSDVLLNLARILFNLKYHDDAIFLTKESLKKSNSPQETWLQHYTLGEIYKAMGKYQESGNHLRKALEINPSFQAAEVHLRELKNTSSIHANLYTILIIVVLIIIVLVVIHKLIITNY